MFLLKKNFLIGLAAGVALTLLSLELWSNYLQKAEASAAQPRILQPLLRQEPARIPESSENLPKPWIPKTANRLHDNWRVRALDGKTVSLAELRGKVIFLNIWSTGCAPCIEQLRGIERLYNSLKKERVAFLAVSMDNTQQAGDFIRQNNLRVPVYVLSQKLPEDFPDQGIPLTLILDPTGAVVFRQVGGLNWDVDNARTYLRSLELQGPPSM